jgi:hypothetical protein
MSGKRKSLASDALTPTPQSKKSRTSDCETPPLHKKYSSTLESGDETSSSWSFSGSVTPGSVHRRSVTPGSVHRRSVTPGSVHRRSASPGSVHSRSVTPGSGCRKKTGRPRNPALPEQVGKFILEKCVFYLVAELSTLFQERTFLT